MISMIFIHLDLLTDLDLESDKEQEIDLDSILSGEHLFEIMEFQDSHSGGSSPESSEYCQSRNYYTFFL